MADPSITRSTRTCILATLFATLAATALIAMFVVIFCPAQVTFLVTDASRSNSSNDSTVSLHLSIFANSSQRRTKVKFESIFIDLFNSSDFLGREEDWRRRINAHVDEMPDHYLKYPGSTNISVSAATPNRTFLDFAPDWLIDHVDLGLTVMVMAQVHFKVGIVRTRLYSITVYCDHVVFPDQRNNNKVSHPTKYMKQEKELSSPDAPQFPVTCHS